MRINVGCGSEPINGWVNFDNSLSVRLFKYYLFARFLHWIGVINNEQMHFIAVGKAREIKWADARKLPISDGSVEIIYSSHMLEHLDRKDAILFLAEAKRVLRVGGVIRLCIPDIRLLVDDYLEKKDADEFVRRTLMCIPRPRTFSEKVLISIVGPRHHQWMYDGKSMCILLESCGFSESKILAPGTTTTSASKGLDLFQHSDHSFYIEAVKKL
jgi:hypothetical protein